MESCQRWWMMPLHSSAWGTEKQVSFTSPGGLNAAWTLTRLWKEERAQRHTVVMLLTPPQLNCLVRFHLDLHLSCCRSTKITACWLHLRWIFLIMDPFSSHFHWSVIYWYWSCDLPASAGRHQTRRVAIRKYLEQWAGRRLSLPLLCSPQVRCLTLYSLQRQERAVGDERSTFRRVSSKVFWGTNLGLRTVSRRQQWLVWRSPDAWSSSVPLVLCGEHSMSSLEWVGGSLTRVAMASISSLCWW